MPEVKINKKKFGEDTEVTLNLKTIAWIVGITISLITTLATIGYFDMKSEIKNQKELFDAEKAKYKEEIKTMLETELKGEVDKRELMYKDIYDIKGDIKVILDRTGGNKNTHFVPENPTSIPSPNR
jgi:hypothetical protein